ncbi:methyltransferase [Paenochrobactrum pullorum]|uniref:methyltransferase n=1 Tax=Paenochrobactrum pullorum TaxID=1324351 RepID=UPI0035BBE7F9
MISGAQQTLFLPFEHEIFDMPEEGSRFLACGIRADRTLDAAWKEVLTCLQPQRPDFLALEREDFKAVPRLEEDLSFDGGLLLLGKHRGRNEAWLAQILTRVKPGGTIIVSGDKKLGIDSFRKIAGGIAEIEDRMSKNHAVAFWFRRPADVTDEQITVLKPTHNLVDGLYYTEAGMFSHQAIDRGSALLVPYLKDIVFGNVADYGAGWGYLSAQALNLAPKLERLDLYEADYESLQAARKNLSHVEKPVAFHWFDLTKEAVTGIYDTVIMNPPFHEGRATDVSLGQSFITAAAKRLKTGGRLLMVANRQLPYEAVLKGSFRVVNLLKDERGFKVIEARK